MQGVPPVIQDLELRDRLSELLGEALGKPEQGAPLYALCSFLSVSKAQGSPEVPSGDLIEAAKSAFHEVGLRVDVTEAIEQLLASKLLQRPEEDVDDRWVGPGEDLRGELSAATSRIEAYCRALETLSQRKVRPENEVERAIEQAACLFNEGLFFEVHEVLEKVWLKQGDQTRPLLQGLIQIAVAFHHLENRNIKGALSLLKEGWEKTKDYRLTRFGLELDQFLQQAEACYHSLASLGGDAFDRFDRQMIPQMRLLE